MDPGTEFTWFVFQQVNQHLRNISIMNIIQVELHLRMLRLHLYVRFRIYDAARARAGWYSGCTIHTWRELGLAMAWAVSTHLVLRGSLLSYYFTLPVVSHLACHSQTTNGQLSDRWQMCSNVTSPTQLGNHVWSTWQYASCRWCFLLFFNNGVQTTDYVRYVYFSFRSLIFKIL